LSLTLIISILFAALGIYIICNPLAFASFIPLVVGMMLIIGSINKFQTAYDLKKLDSGASVKVLILAILTIVFGIILVFNPFASVTLFIRIIGALLIFDGLSNLYSIYSYSKVK
jgi:uncharacterized membrane protein HdeD (DUF308 family)